MATVLFNTLYRVLFELILAGKLRPGRLVSKTIPLERAPEELKAMTGFNTLGAIVIDRF